MAIPTELREWLKDQMRAIENKTLEHDKAKKIFKMIKECKHSDNATIICEIIEELAEEKKAKAVQTPR